MAKEAYTKVPLLLSDGTEVTLKPLNIAAMKRFMRAFKGMQDVGDDEVAGFDVFVTCAGIALEKELSGKVARTRPNGEESDEEYISPQYREYLEETLDMETIYKVFEVGAQMKLNDPNLLRAAAEAQAGMS